MNRFYSLTFVTLSLLITCGFISADEKLKGIACRSVHLGFPSPEGTAFYNEMKIVSSAPGTYFMVCGWNKGYFGIQEQASGKKLLIFSVWDSEQNDPKAVKEDNRTKLIYKDEKTRIGRFGGEGTGGQSFYDFDWKIDQTYRFLVTSKVEGKRSIYSGFFFHPELNSWIHMVSFSTLTNGSNLKGYYSFIEDFKRDKVSTTFARKAEFGNTWVKSLKEGWVSCNSATFTADANPALSINAGFTKDRFFLVTGGDTKNTFKLKDSIKIEGLKTTHPNDLPKN